MKPKPVYSQTYYVQPEEGDAVVVTIAFSEPINPTYRNPHVASLQKQTMRQFIAATESSLRDLFNAPEAYLIRVARRQ